MKFVAGSDQFGLSNPSVPTTALVSKATPCKNEYAWSNTMRRFFRFGTKKPANLNTEFARARFAKSMPGEMAALESLRLGRISL